MANNNYYDGNHSTTVYGAQGGIDGGGFLGASQVGSQDTSGGNKNLSKDNLRPLTIKQIIEAQQPHPDGEFKVDGVEVTQITFICQIQSISPQTTNVTYRVDDGTGLIEVKLWIDSDAIPENKTSTPKENDYIRVWGRLRTFNNKRHVGAHMIRPITDFNEVSYHFLETTAVHLYFTRGPPPSVDNIKSEASLGMFVDQSRPTAGAFSTGASRRLGTNISAAARKVYNLLLSVSNNGQGMNVPSIATKLGMDLNEVFKAGEELNRSGIISPTIDDETWAVIIM